VHHFNSFKAAFYCQRAARGCGLVSNKYTKLLSPSFIVALIRLHTFTRPAAAAAAAAAADDDDDVHPTVVADDEVPNLNTTQWGHNAASAATTSYQQQRCCSRLPRISSTFNRGVSSQHYCQQY
jgi:hypothetical protein